MDRKPENGCEVQNACDGQSGIMLRLKMVKSEQSDLLNKDLNHDTKVLAFLVMPWARSLHTVVADSYYASVQTACYAYKIVLQFIGVVETATKGFPMDHVRQAQFVDGRRQWTELFHRSNGTNDDPDLHAFAWCDHERRYKSETLRISARPSLSTLWRYHDYDLCIQ